MQGIMKVKIEFSIKVITVQHLHDKVFVCKHWCDSEFQTVSPATEKAQLPSWQRLVAVPQQ